jgi:hypothetical protein
MTTKLLTHADSQLPNKLFCVFLAHFEYMTKREAAKATINTIKVIYEKAGICMLQDHKMAEEVEKLHTAMDALPLITAK